MLYGVKNPHGGDRYGDGIALDFSANVSPLGTPKCVTEAIERGLPELYRYPDPYCRALVQAIARYEGVPGEFILCGNGASELIYAYCEAVRPGRAMELAPTFSEYSLALQRRGCGVVRFALSQEEKFDLQERFLARLAREKIDALFLCNPNNPTGRLIAGGLLETDLDTREDLALFLDIGTNGELVLGCRDFLLMGAGAAGPALEGAVSHSGMRAEPGAICSVKIGADNRLRYQTIGDLPPKGICGSGILDLIAEGFLSGWIDSAGNLQKSASPCIRDVWDDTRQRNVPAIIYAYDGNVPLYFTQDDIGEFLTCKAAAHTMVATLLESVNVSPSEIGAFYLAGGFGTHYDLESAITVGLYPDLPREKFKILGNSSLAGAKRLLLDTGCRARLDQIRALATYVQFGEMEKFVENMQAARFLPHTDASRYPSVMRRLRERGKTFPPGKLAAERSGAD